MVVCVLVDRMVAVLRPRHGWQPQGPPRRVGVEASPEEGLRPGKRGSKGKKWFFFSIQSSFAIAILPGQTELLLHKNSRYNNIFTGEISV